VSLASLGGNAKDWLWVLQIGLDVSYREISCSWNLFRFVFVEGAELI
jgi:hypothetical protein